LRVNLAGFPDAICALAVIACFIEGKTVLEDIGVCHRKETDRIVVMKSELEKLGAKVEEGEDYLAIYGNSPLLANGEKNPNFKLHGGTVESFDDHRVAMSLACLGLGLPEGEQVIVNDAECCSVSFPKFFEVMNKINANFTEI
jgi:3-phosphoshikimate 1-carboxyvinyltransferase